MYAARGVRPHSASRAQRGSSRAACLWAPWQAQGIGQVGARLAQSVKNKVRRKWFEACGVLRALMLG